jgi:hypothetical protein
MSDDDADVHRPWFETARGKAQFGEATAMLRRMVYQPGSGALRGRDRLKIRQVPQRTCTRCHQVLPNQPIPYVLTDDEYRIVDSALKRAYDEFVLAARDKSMWHMAQAYHIVDSQLALLDHGLHLGLAMNVSNFQRLVRRLFGGSVPDRDVQTS